MLSPITILTPPLQLKKKKISRFRYKIRLRPIQNQDRFNPIQPHSRSVQSDSTKLKIGSIRFKQTQDRFNPIQTNSRSVQPDSTTLKIGSTRFNQTQDRFNPIQTNSRSVQPDSTKLKIGSTRFNHTQDQLNLSQPKPQVQPRLTSGKPRSAQADSKKSKFGSPNDQLADVLTILRPRFDFLMYKLNLSNGQLNLRGNVKNNISAFSTIISLHLGLPLVPSYLGRNRSIEEMMHGVNYASAASGIIFSSGSELGQHVSLTQQIQQYMDTFDLFITSFGEESAVNLISSSVFYISIGTNDYIHYYLRNVSGVQTTYFPWSFNLFLVNSVRKEIRKLYDSSARKVVVMGLAPMGCAPHYLWKYNSTNGECIQEINDMITEFNYGMRYMVQELNRELRGASIIFCDVFASAMELIKSPGRFGYSVTTDACCGVGKYKGWILCISPLMACHNASTHIWWDQFHPTDAVNEMLADNIWSSLHSDMCYPINLREMVTRDTK